MPNGISGLMGWTLMGIGAAVVYELVRGRNPWTDLVATVQGKALPAASHLQLAATTDPSTLADDAGGLQSVDDGSSGNASSGAPASSNFSGNAGAFISLAESKAGGKYVWGGAGPTNFDCSGLVMFCAKHALNYNKFVHDSAQQQLVCSNLSGESAALPGDLAFWGRPAHHVGIYIGNHTVFHAGHHHSDQSLDIHAESISTVFPYAPTFGRFISAPSNQAVKNQRELAAAN